MIVRLALMSYFDLDPSDSEAIDARLERAFNLFSLRCLAERKFPALKQFTKAKLQGLRRGPSVHVAQLSVALHTAGALEEARGRYVLASHASND